MRTIQTINISNNKKGYIQETGLDDYYVRVVQTYNGDEDVIIAKTYKTLTGAQKFLRNYK